jgi:chromosomal replication initiation ATPase DnaA
MKAKINKKHSDILLEIVNNIFQSDVMSTVRCRGNVDGRRAFCAILRNEGHSYTKIAEVLNKNHATVIHYVRGIEGILQTDSAFAKRYDTASMMFLKKRDLVTTSFIKR